MKLYYQQAKDVNEPHFMLDWELAKAYKSRRYK